MEDGISCDDPQFLDMFETCLRVKLENARKELSCVESEKKDFKARVKEQLNARKELKKAMQNTQENIVVLTDALNKQNKYVGELSNAIELTKANLDGDYKDMTLEFQQHQDILKDYEKTWQEYHAKYEEFPLAKARMEMKVKVEKLRVQKMVTEYKINETKKRVGQRERIAWMRTRGKIVDFAREMVNDKELDERLESLNKRIENRKEELNALNNEVAARKKMQEEEKKVRARKLLEMPPPKVHCSKMRTMYESAIKTNFTEGLKSNFENSFDSMSVDTMMLEQMCLGDDNSNQFKNKSTPEDSTEPRSPVVSLGQGDMEREDAASETDENMDGEGVDTAVDEGQDHPLNDEDRQENPKEPASASVRDKRAVAESHTEKEDVSTPKKMRLISDEDKTFALPACTLKGAQQKMTKSRDASVGPRIAKIQTVRYKIGSVAKAAQGNPNSPSAFKYGRSASFRGDNNLIDTKDDHLAESGADQATSVAGVSRYNVTPKTKTAQDNRSFSGTSNYGYSDKGSFWGDKNLADPKGLADLSPTSTITKLGMDRYMSPMTKMDKPNVSRGHWVPSPCLSIAKTEAGDYNASPSARKSSDVPNISGLFIPRPYDYSDNSNLSFQSNNMANMKADQMSYDGSMRDLYECSISASMKNPEMNPRASSTANLPTARAGENFPLTGFNFSGIAKANEGRKNLF
ncbi:uncharacterized protein LOC128886807 [Hylaeus anthracinus]|uniref:uncharacterized protein LOC128886807 n=1 Tax=Hylaeus anthracinus TaxID=313031 RepID=UPI0023B9C205|nr:uncharacterized protein LOC128886807 [Hylaeus anthracinus]